MRRGKAIYPLEEERSRSTIRVLTLTHHMGDGEVFFCPKESHLRVSPLWQIIKHMLFTDELWNIHVPVFCPCHKTRGVLLETKGQMDPFLCYQKIEQSGYDEDNLE